MIQYPQTMVMVIESLMQKLAYLMVFMSFKMAAQLQPSIEPITAFHNTTWEWTDGNQVLKVTLRDTGYESVDPLEGNTFFSSL